MLYRARVKISAGGFMRHADQREPLAAMRYSYDEGLIDLARGEVISTPSC